MSVSRIFTGSFNLVLAFVIVSGTDQLMSGRQLNVTGLSLELPPFPIEPLLNLLNPLNAIGNIVQRARRAENESNFQGDEVGWSNINQEVDMVIPMMVEHLQKLDIDHLVLPDMKETISLGTLFMAYEPGLYLTNGIVYNMAGIQRYNDAFMTYEDKSFLTRFFILIKNLQFEYNFLLKIIPVEGYGKVIGSLDDTVIYAELAINLSDLKLKLNDFRILNFSNINVQLGQLRIIRQLTGVILSPITNLFRQRITTSISDGLKDQMQVLMDDFNDNDPLELRKFTQKMIASLIGKAFEPGNKQKN